jgi:hypothetical protein
MAVAMLRAPAPDGIATREVNVMGNLVPGSPPPAAPSQQIVLPCGLAFLFGLCG